MEESVALEGLGDSNTLEDSSGNNEACEAPPAGTAPPQITANGKEAPLARDTPTPLDSVTDTEPNLSMEIATMSDSTDRNHSGPLNLRFLSLNQKGFWGETEPLSLRVSMLNERVPGQSSMPNISRTMNDNDMAGQKSNRRRMRISLRRASFHASRKLNLGTARHAKVPKHSNSVRGDTTDFPSPPEDSSLECMATFKNFNTWHNFVVQVAEEKTRGHKYFKTADMNIIAPLCLFLDGNSSLDPTDDAMQVIFLYQTKRKPIKYTIPAINSDENHTPGTVNEIKNILRPVETFLGGEYPHTIYCSAYDKANMDFAAGTVEALVDGLIFSQDLEDTYRFVLAYRFFMEPKVLMLSLIEWYNVRFEESILEEKQAKIKKILKGTRVIIQKRVLKIIEIWIKTFWQDFYEGEDGTELCKLLVAFIEFAEQNPKIGLQSLLRTIREQIMLGFGLSLVSLPLNINVEPEGIDERGYLESISLRRFARYCYSISMSYMKIIPISAYMEFLHRPFDLDSECPRFELCHLLNFMSWLRSIGVYVMASIDTQDQRSSKKQIKRAIILAKELRSCGDYSSLSAVLWALKTPRVASMTSVWSTLRRKYRALVCDLDSMFSPSKNYSAYWDWISGTRLAVVPYMAPHMSKAIRTNNEVTTNLRKEAFMPSSPKKSPIILLEDLYAAKARTFTSAAGKSLESCYSIFRPAEAREDRQLGYVTTLTRKSTATLNQPGYSQTVTSCDFTKSNPSLHLPSNPPSPKEANTISCNEGNEADKQYSKAHPSPESAIIVPSLKPITTLSNSADTRSVSLINFQKYIDIQDVILDMVALSGIDTTNYREEKEKPRLIPRYAVDDMRSQPFMKCIIKIAENCDLDPYSSICESIKSS